MRAYIAIHRIIDGTIPASSLPPYGGEICTSCSPGGHAVQWVPSSFGDIALVRNFIRTDVVSFTTQDNARTWASLDASMAAMAGSLVCGFLPDNATSAYILIVHTWAQSPKPAMPNNCSQCPPRLGVSGRWIVGTSLSNTPIVVANPSATYVMQFADEPAVTSWLASTEGTAFVNNCLVAGFSIP